jgi:hypothetical protein
VVAQARKLAGMLSADATNNDDPAFISAGFEAALTRSPTVDELAACVQYLEAQREQLQSTDKLTTFEAGPAIETAASPDPAQRARENLIQVLINHTDFVTRR